METGSKKVMRNGKVSGEAMVQTSPASRADQPPVPGATAVRILGILLVLQGGWKLYAAINAIVQAFERAINANYVAFYSIVSGVIGLFTVNAGILLVRRDRSGKVFGLVVCSIALAHQLFAVGSILTSLSALGRSPMLLGTVYWIISLGSIVLFLASIVVIACWRPHRVPGA